MTFLDELGDTGFDTAEGAAAFAAMLTLSGPLAGNAVEADAAAAFPAASFDLLAEAGIMGLRIPREFGGSGLSPADYCRVLSRLAAADLPSAVAFNMHASALLSLALLGTEMQKRRWFARVVEDGAIVAALGSEKGLKPLVDGGLPRTVLMADDGGYRLTGEKSYCSFGSAADALYVAARLGDGVAFALVDARADGIARADDWNVMAMRSTESVTTRFDAVAVAAEDVVRCDDLGFALLLEMEFALGYGPAYLAAACAAADLALAEHASLAPSREERPQPDATLYRLAAESGAIAVSARAAWLACLDAARCDAVGSFRRARAIALAKAFASDTACDIAASALRMRGGRGLGAHDPVGRTFRDVQAGQVMAFSPEIVRDLLGRLRLGLAPPHIQALAKS